MYIIIYITCSSYVFLVDDEEIEKTVFNYKTEIKELIPVKPDNTEYNPFYQVADFYEPCRNSTTQYEQFDTEVVQTWRGHGLGIQLSNLSSELSVSV